MKMARVPENWQQQAMEAVAEFRKTGPVYGVLLPETWKGELSAFMRDGQLRKMLGVARVGFGPSKEVERVEEPAKPQVKTEKPKR
jgi:hypothetical protein